MNKIDEIKKALAMATPGPWEARAWGIDTNDKYFVVQKGENGKEIATVWKGIRYQNMPEISDKEALANAYLIANAPKWLRFLLSELDRIEREYAEERAAHNAHVTELCELEQERNMYKSSSEVFYERLKKADEEREKLIEVLRWYGNQQNYKYPSIGGVGAKRPIDYDRGERARDIIKAVGNEVERKY